MSHNLPTLAEAARALGGEVSGSNQILCPGPGHSAGDRSLSVLLTESNFVVNSFAGDDPLACKDHVRERLGLPDFHATKTIKNDDLVKRVSEAARIWSTSTPITDTLAEHYFLQQRQIDVRHLGDLNDVLRWHQGQQCVVALMTDAASGDAVGVHRTFLNADGSKRERKMLGRKGVIRLSCAVPPASLAICEGLEDGLALALKGCTVWCAADAGNLGKLPVLAGVTSLSIFADADEAGLKGANDCAVRWTEAGREVRLIPPEGEKDWDAAILAGADPLAAFEAAKVFAADNRNPEDALLPLINAAELCKQPVEEREWLVPNVIPLNTVSALYGDGGTGKSLIALQLAKSTALGTDWLGFPVLEQGPVLYLSAEDDLKELRRRLADVLAQHGGASDLHNLTIAPLAGKDAVLATGNRNNVIEGTKLWEAVQSTIAILKPKLVIIDNLADVFAGEENSRPQARQFVGMLRGEAITHQLAVLMLCHPSLTGINSGSGTSGSTAWNNSVRSRLYLERLLDSDRSEDDADVRRLTVVKTNYSKQGDYVTVRWKGGVFVRDDEGASAPGRGAQDAAKEVEYIFLNLLRRYLVQGRSVNANGGVNYAPRLFEQDPDAKGVKKRAFGRAMAALLNAGKIRIVRSKRSTSIEIANDETEEAA